MRRHSRATAGAGAIAHNLAPATQFQLNEVRVHLDIVGGAGDLTITLNAAAGAAYDQVLLTQDMTAVLDLILLPVQPHDFVAGDEIDVAWPNVNDRTYGLDVIWSRTA